MRDRFQAGDHHPIVRSSTQIMGDKSPKATSKKAAQKQTKSDTNTQRKNKAVDAKHVVKAKK